MPMKDDGLVNRARDNTRRYRFHNWTLIPDYGRIVGGFLSAPRTVRWAITLSIVALIMSGPLVGIAVAVLR
jgi:hypothetical protein